MKALHDSVCEYCGSGFTRHRNSIGRFCSVHCKRDAVRIPEKTCPVCNKLFKPSNRKVVNCSVECVAVLKRSPRRSLPCDRCGGPMPQKGNSSHRFCSSKCANQRRNTAYAHHDVGSVQEAGLGYLKVKTESGWVLQHRYVMSQILGRPLEKHERVHHRNGNRADNSPENLELWKVKKKDPAGVRAADYHCAGCLCFQHSQQATA